MTVVTMREALNQALREEMLRDENVFLMGEEVGAYQGAYKVTKGLLDELGEKRVIDTPITELGFAGLGVGAAMVGLRPIVEFMTFNFSILATDQIINSAAKMFYMSGGQFNIPIVFRGPGGSAFQVSSQHSQALESWFAYFPGLKVVMPSTPADAKGLLKSAIRDDDPVIFIEQERMYGIKGEVPDDPDFTIPLGVADIKREGTDATIIARSLMVPVALKAAEVLEKQGVSCEVIDRGRFDHWTLIRSSSLLRKQTGSWLQKSHIRFAAWPGKSARRLRSVPSTISTRPLSESPAPTSLCPTQKTSKSWLFPMWTRLLRPFVRSPISTKLSARCPSNFQFIG